jgi:hypothetical protein
MLKHGPTTLTITKRNETKIQAVGMKCSRSMEGTGNEIFKKAGIHILLVKLEKK